jgi:hypothetical protein
MYRLYYTFHGSLDRSLASTQASAGWKAIAEVQQLKKKIRKLNLRMKQEEQDLITASEDPEDINIGIVEGSSIFLHLRRPHRKM